MSFRDFENGILLGLYRAWQDGREMVPLGNVAGANNLDYERGWLVRVHDSLSSKGFIAGPPNRRIEEMTLARLTADGLLYVEDNLIAERPAEDAVPASDRLVALNDNSPEYRKISEDLRSLRENLRAANEFIGDEVERNRISHSLEAAESLWSAAQLKVIQIKVGIIMTLEDAQKVFTGTVRAVTVGLIVDAIKSFIKSRTGIDLDHI